VAQAEACGYQTFSFGWQLVPKLLLGNANSSPGLCLGAICYGFPGRLRHPPFILWLKADS
jgi:hypothetical protein